MNKKHLADESVYPAIYDFSLLPYALGDILTWNVKMCIRATLLQKKTIDIYLCADSQSPSCVYQKNQIDASNYQWHLFELLPTFGCNPMLRNIYLYTDRSSFGQAIQALKKSDPSIQPHIAEYEKALHGSYSSFSSNQSLNTYCSSHKDINAFYATYNYIPQLVAPKACYKDTIEFCRAIGKDKCIVALNFRTRNRDASIINSEENRNVYFPAWHDFLKMAETQFPDVRFLLLGKIREKPLMLLRLSNVIVPRLNGLDLGHELALMEICDFFMGSSSGFAAMANFGDLPYVITKMNKRACECFDIPFGEKKLPFAKENQILVYDEESPKMLLSHFGKLYKSYTKNPKFRETEEASKPFLKEEDIKTHVLFSSLEAAKSDLKAHAHEKMVRVTKLIESGDLIGALALLEKVSEEQPDFPHLNSVRAMILYQMKKFSEAREAIDKELACQPLNEEIRSFRNLIDLATRQYGASS